MEGIHNNLTVSFCLFSRFNLLKPVTAYVDSDISCTMYDIISFNGHRQHLNLISAGWRDISIISKWANLVKNARESKHKKASKNDSKIVSHFTTSFKLFLKS